MIERKRNFNATEQERLLSGMRDARRVLLRAGQSMPRCSTTRAGTDQIITQIDELAKLLTGAREHFWESDDKTPEDRPRISPTAAAND